MSASQDVPVFSGIPEGLQRPVKPDSSVCLLDAIEVLTEHLTPSLCGLVFRRVRKNERERKWTFAAIAQFWTAMIVRNPPSLTHGLAEGRKRRNKENLWPRVMAEPQAFFQKCADLRADFFEVLFNEFTARLQADAQPLYASWLEDVRAQFGQVLVIDGSRLESVCHRLKILWPVKHAVLGGCVTAVYDLFTGTIRQARFYGHAFSSERARAPEFLNGMQTGTLVLGDRMYCMIKSFHQLNALKTYGLFRARGYIQIKRVEVLSAAQSGRAFCEDTLVDVGQGIHEPKVRLRLIRYRDRGYKLDLLTNALDTRKLPAETAARLYGMRWSIERLFLDLKKTLNLNCLYASHPNLVAQQFYAAAMVYNAFRIAQGTIATKAGILPEQLSSGKLFPLLTQASNDYAVARWQATRVRELNPGIEIAFPDLRTMPTATSRLKTILAQRRRSPRKPPAVFSRGRTKSFAHVPGGIDLLTAVTDG